MSVKEDSIAMIQRMPEDTDLADIIEQLYFKRKIDNRLADISSGNTITHEQATEISRWLE